MAKRLRDYGLQSERLLWPTKGPSHFEEELGADELEQALGLTTLEKAIRWAQTKSMWPDTFGLACCAIEMMSIVSARYDIARFGMEAFRSSPRQADLMIVSGRVSHKMAAPRRPSYDQMVDPTWVSAASAAGAAAPASTPAARSGSTCRRTAPRPTTSAGAARPCPAIPAPPPAAPSTCPRRRGSRPCRDSSRLASPSATPSWRARTALR